MRSLAVKLSIAFLIVGLLGVGLIALFASRTTQYEFRNFIFDEYSGAFIEQLAEHYRTHGGWSDIQEALPLPDRFPFQGQGQGPGPRTVNFITLTDSSGSVTTGLLHAVRYIKDNRLLPRGWSEEHPAPASMIAAAAITDFTNIFSSLSAEDRLTQRLVQYDFRSRLDAWKLDTELLRVSQLFGLHNRVYLVVDRMPAHTLHDYENIIARLHAIPAYVDQNIALMDEAVSNGITQPRIVVDLVTRQITAQMNQDAQHTELLRAFRAFPSNISPADQGRLRQEAVTAYEQQFLPSWHKLHDYMVNTYSKHVR